MIRSASLAWSKPFANCSATAREVHHVFRLWRPGGTPKPAKDAGRGDAIERWGGHEQSLSRSYQDSGPQGATSHSFWRGPFTAKNERVSPPRPADGAADAPARGSPPHRRTSGSRGRLPHRYPAFPVTGRTLVGAARCPSRTRLGIISSGWCAPFLRCGQQV